MRGQGWRGATAFVALTVVLGGVVAFPSAASAEGRKCPDGAEKPKDASDVSKSKLWAYDLLDVKRVWPLTKGEGVKVAVIDSGVQADMKLLDGRVGSGKAYIDNKEQEKASGGDAATEDCDGHGTEVASIIAGSPDEESGFYGIAPEAEIIPYRISNKRPGKEAQAAKEDAEDKDQEIIVDENDFADAIDEAVKAKAKVINLSVKYKADYKPIRDAIANAVKNDVVVVAAAGNNGADPKPGETYPANYPNVIGVGAVDKNESRLATSQKGPWVDVVAPGASIAAPLPNGKYDTEFGGTSGATAFVSGTAALLRAQHKDWSAEEVAKQIMSTASPTAGGTGMTGDEDVEGNTGGSPGYGHGRVDPYMAVTQKMSASEAKEMDMDAPAADPAAVKRNADFAKMKTWALWIGLGALGLFVAALAGVGALRRGKKGKWHVKRVDKSDHIEPFDDGDPIPVFQGIKGLKE
ncbi:S8 family serine peptidase [Stackebrandtia nassauensis]|uniref:Peptidase S8 and S53 subtilisin kexin sedolisin n=1 Tax=Stackebrandtia nassauensis (strain DSM 44728 / CIP 108903 / NRRL B-16338 / NBRC 102104 / LLR-40K-21) TaxID=446470 RepID=D3Q703_STANL|nr:S8 family serine peptidase [Stackebrandtia nassauensis]ADD40402.1 peptidase S8 and S53 subtilisin kexin sedolisin [Stackebrandtia nassauensis DSM 44728]